MSTELSVELMLRAMKAFKDFSYQYEPVLLPPNLYDRAKEKGIDLTGYVRREKCPRRKTGYIATKTQGIKEFNTGHKQNQPRNSFQQQKPFAFRCMKDGACATSNMTTKGKTWKWKKDAKRNWKWSEDKIINNKNAAKYFGLNKYALNHFRYMQQRVSRDNRVCDFSWDRKGYVEFCKEMGPIPQGMKRPSVGRISHDKGYVKGNIRWESHRYNSWRSRRQEDNPNQAPPFEEEIPF